MAGEWQFQLQPKLWHLLLQSLAAAAKPFNSGWWAPKGEKVSLSHRQWDSDSLSCTQNSEGWGSRPTRLLPRKGSSSPGSSSLEATDGRGCGSC